MNFLHNRKITNSIGIIIMRELIKSSILDITLSTRCCGHQYISTVDIKNICNFIGSGSTKNKSQDVTLEKVFYFIQQLNNIIVIYKSSK